VDRLADALRGCSSRRLAASSLADALRGGPELTVSELADALRGFSRQAGQSRAQLRARWHMRNVAGRTKSSL